MGNYRFAELSESFTSLGFRFWDSVLDRQICDGLLVKAWPVSESGSGPETTAFRTPSGNFALHGLPGMRDIELPGESGPVTFTNEGVPIITPDLEKTFLIEVIDKQDRFIPVVFTVQLPLPYRGLYLVGETSSLPGSPGSLGSPGSPPQTVVPGFYLFSAPTRTVTAGTAAIQATLMDNDSGIPATYAVVEVEVQTNGGSSRWYGIADHRGSVTVQFPYPAIDIPLSNSPPSPTTILLDQQQWQLTIRVQYAPADVATANVATSDEYPARMRTASRVPLLASILSQTAGRIYTERPDPPAQGTAVSQWSTTLTYGQQLVLKSDETEESQLWIDAGP